MKKDELDSLLLSGIRLREEAHVPRESSAPRFYISLELNNSTLHVRADAESEETAIEHAAAKAITFIEVEQSRKLDELCLLQKQLKALLKIVNK